MFESQELLEGVLKEVDRHKFDKIFFLVSEAKDSAQGDRYNLVTSTLLST
ncbi:hypothetical protein SP41_58 [Salmonella phage 41]|nr:hypothetical protein SP41_58 [Salmonella phage 41]